MLGQHFPQQGKDMLTIARFRAGTFPSPIRVPIERLRVKHLHVALVIDLPGIDTAGLLDVDLHNSSLTQQGLTFLASARRKRSQEGLSAVWVDKQIGVVHSPEVYRVNRGNRKAENVASF